MNNTHLREKLVDQADQSFSAITRQVDLLLDCAHFYAIAVNKQQTRAELIKSDQLLVAIKDLDGLLRMLGKQIELWKREEQGALSNLGVELQFLNELTITIEVIMLFLLRENIPVEEFDLDLVLESHYNLVRCNRLL